MQTKSLLIIRHAKSSWDNIGEKDFDRALNERGKKDAPFMARQIKKQNNITLDAIVSSPAKRAVATSKFFAEVFNIKKKNIIEAHELYEPSLINFYNVVAALNDDFTTMALFSHNPGITAFANMLTSTRIDDMPTCAVFAVHIKTNSWKNFKTAQKEFWFFDYPKNLHAD